jgi:hypothetical protein
VASKGDAKVPRGFVGDLKIRYRNRARETEADQYKPGAIDGG